MPVSSPANGTFWIKPSSCLSGLVTAASKKKKRERKDAENFSLIKKKVVEIMLPELKSSLESHPPPRDSRGPPPMPKKEATVQAWVKREGQVAYPSGGSSIATWASQSLTSSNCTLQEEAWTPGKGQPGRLLKGAHLLHGKAAMTEPDGGLIRAWAFKGCNEICQRASFSRTDVTWWHFPNMQWKSTHSTSESLNWKYYKCLAPSQKGTHKGSGQAETEGGGIWPGPWDTPPCAPSILRWKAG